VSLTDDLLALQDVDTAIDLLGHRRARLPERDAAAAAEQRRRANITSSAATSARRDELAAAVAADEAESERLTKQRERLQAQLKTVIAPREAEALMHEIDAIAERRNALDDVELEHLEEDAALADQQAALDADRPGLDDASSEATAALAAAEAGIDAELADLRGRRGGLSDVLAERVRADYESRRKHFGGVAVARLNGKTCSGCHLDLSTSDVEQVRRTPPDKVADCPQCGRMLVP
jgi:predicted  nucleic acid-binding Zn-ribbon protein